MDPREETRLEHIRRELEEIRVPVLGRYTIRPKTQDQAAREEPAPN